MTKEKKKERRRRGQVIERAPGVFLIRIALARDARTGRRSYHNETFYGTRTQADKRCIGLLAKVDDGTFFQPSAATVGELLNRWLEHTRRRGVRAITLDHYEYKANKYLRPAIGDIPLKRLTTPRLQELFDTLQDKGLAPSTVRNARAVLSHALRYAVRMNLLKENPLAGVEIPALKRRPVRAMTEEEAAIFVSAARQHPKGLIFVLWLFTSLRPAEFLGLRWTDIELAGECGVLHVRRSLTRIKGGGWETNEPKTAKGRRDVYFPAWLYQDLMEHKAQQSKERIGWRHDHDLVFAATDGEPLHRHNLSARGLKPILKQAELPAEFTLYSLRRSFSSLLRRAGVSAKEVAEQMGHIRPDFTDEVYVAVYDSAKREMVERLESALLPDACTLPAHNEDAPLM